MQRKYLNIMNAIDSKEHSNKSSFSLQPWCNSPVSLRTWVDSQTVGNPVSGLTFPGNGKWDFANCTLECFLIAMTFECRCSAIVKLLLPNSFYWLSELNGQGSSGLGTMRLLLTLRWVQLESFSDSFRLHSYLIVILPTCINGWMVNLLTHSASCLYE